MGRYPWTEYILFEVLYTIFPYPTRHHIYRVVILTAMIYLAAKIYLTQEASDSLWLQYAAGFMVATHFIFIAYLLFAEGPFPDHWRRIRDETDVGGLDKLPSNFPFTKKLWWMFDIGWGARMIGWVQGPRNLVPPHPPPSRRTFLQKAFVKLVMHTVIADLSTSLLALSPPFDHRLHDPTDGPETYLAAVPLLQRVPYVVGWAIRTATPICIRYDAIVLLCVGLGHSSPTLWPYIWGSWGDAYTVRRLWGKTWHQQLRPMLAGLGRLIANKFLKFPRGTNLSSYTQLYVAFFLSGLLHFSGDFVLEKRVASRSFKFFLLQAAAITFEDFVIHITKRFLHRREMELKPRETSKSRTGVVVRVIGYCWVMLWLCLTLPVWQDELSALGFSSTDRKPIAKFLLNQWNRWA